MNPMVDWMYQNGTTTKTRIQSPENPRESACFICLFSPVNSDVLQWSRFVFHTL